ncbi:reverse transcriptase domain-containing protein [Tanacetum coccineum]|uniref:Reverse transcriptase domain-containing protein n=1 Tax=Tanacetum coccineum TaxID=301880 RepID=A0ABQ4X6E6_9ASTR
MANLMGQMQKDLQERPQGAFLSNTIPNPRKELKAITTRSDLLSFLSPVSSPSEPPKQNPHQPLILYPLRLNKEKLQDKSDIQVHKFFQMFKKLHFNISLAEALALMPKYHKMLKDLLSEKEKLLGLANTSLTENCSAVLLKKLPEKLRDPGKFLIPCDFPELEKCMALADLGASLNLMPLSVWKKLMLPKLVHIRMTFELANRSIAYPPGIAEDVFVQVGKFTFLADFVVVNYNVNPSVPLILGRHFLRTAHALVDVYVEELILRDGDEKLIFHAESTLRHPHKHGNESINMINIMDITCEDHFEEVLKIQKSIHWLSGSPTPSDLVVESLSRSPIPCGDSESLLEETDTLLSHFDDFSPDYETLCFDFKEKSSGSTTSHSYHSLPEYESFCFDIDHTEEKSSGSTTSHSDLLFLIHELNDFPLLLSDCDSIFSEKFSEIDLLVLFPSGNKDKVFDPEIFTINGVNSNRFSILLRDDFSSILFVRDFLFLTDPSEIETFLSFPFRNEDKIPFDESKVHIEVLSMLWGNRLPTPNDSLSLSRFGTRKLVRDELEVQSRLGIGLVFGLDCRSYMTILECHV